jgi:misacylated tRNA(Ala) deacylase
MTEEIFREDAYARACEAKVVGVNERGGIVLSRTVCYPTGGGQPGDSGRLVLKDGREVRIATTLYDADGRTIVHVPAEGQPSPAVGDALEAHLDWDRRYAHMRAHTALHLLCSQVPFPVTGGQVGAAEGRLDFDIKEAGLDKDELTARINALVEKDAGVSHRWISDEEMAANLDLVRTMSVKPPMGRGRVRLVEIAGIDLQPCGGTHVRSTGEIGRAAVTKIEKKGAQNRRIRIELAKA